MVAFAALPIVLAHVAISLIVLTPRDGETVLPDFPLVVLGQRTLGGVDATTFTVEVDGRPLDPATGRLRPRPQGPAHVPIRVGQRLQVPIRGLAPGPHRLEIEYRPDQDEPSRTTVVRFTVSGRAQHQPSRTTPAVIAAGVVVLLGVGAAAGLVARRSRSR